MKIFYNNGNRDQQEIDTKKIIIKLNDDVDFEILINQFGELVVQKQQYGNGDGAINLKPSVSNEIRLS